jgi:hypothetical protein
MQITDVLESITKREAQCWQMAEAFLANRDAHGLHDMGVEIQALQRARAEVEKVKGLP